MTDGFVRRERPPKELEEKRCIIYVLAISECVCGPYMGNGLRNFYDGCLFIGKSKP